MRFSGLGSVLGVALFTLVLGCDNKPTAVTVSADVNAGKALAETGCKACHDLNGKGVVRAIPNLAAQRESYLFGALKAYQSGQRRHAALQDITAKMGDQDMRNVAGFYAGLPPLVIAMGSAGPLSPYDRGKSATQVCVECHGVDGNSTIAGVPSLAGQQPRYFVAATQAYLHGARKIESMENVLRGLNKIEMENMAVYFASQTPVQRPASAAGDPVSGQPLSAACGGCHGSNGVSHDATTPNLAGQDALYLIAAIKAYRDGARQHTDMHQLLSDSSDQGIANISAYYSTQSPVAAETMRTTVEQLAEKCNRCHNSNIANPNVISDASLDSSLISSLDSRTPKLNGQDKDYLVMALRAYQDGKRDSSTMHNMSLPYSDTVIDSIATWYAMQPAN